MIKTETRDIDGNAYQVSQLTASEGRAMLVLLIKILGPSLGRLIDSSETTIGSSISGAIFELSTNLTDQELKKVCETFGKYTMVSIEGKDQRLDLNLQEIFFAGKYGTMFKWLGFSLEANYRDFFESMANASANLGNVQEMLANASKRSQSQK